jgi:glucoamylase
MYAHHSNYILKDNAIENDIEQAPGNPGIPARWTSSAKSGVGTALNPSSRVWFTLSLAYAIWV